MGPEWALAERFWDSMHRTVYQECWGNSLSTLPWSLRPLPKWNGTLRCKAHFSGTRPSQARLLSPASPAAGWHHCSPIKPGPFPAAAALGAGERLKGLSCVTFPLPQGRPGSPNRLTQPMQGNKGNEIWFRERTWHLTFPPKHFKVIVTGKNPLTLIL